MSDTESASRSVERLNQSQYAQRIGVSRQRVSDLVKAGKIAKDENGKIDPIAADIALARVADPSKAGVIEANNRKYGTNRNPMIAAEIAAQSEYEQKVLAGLPPVYEPPTPPKKKSYHDVKTEREETLHEINKIELAVAEAKFISREDAARLAFEAARSWRGQITKVQVTLPTTIEGLIRKHLADVDADRVRKLKHEIGLAINDAHRTALDVVASEVEALGESLSAAQS
ncbi:MAG: hypothetical protein ACRCWJ_17460 [Casimicrobium sp.]